MGARNIYEAGQLGFVLFVAKNSGLALEQFEICADVDRALFGFVDEVDAEIDGGGVGWATAEGGEGFQRFLAAFAGELVGGGHDAAV